MKIKIVKLITLYAFLFENGTRYKLNDELYIYGIHHWRIFRSSYRKLAWVRFELNLTESVRASERNSVVVGSNPTQASFLQLLQIILQWWIPYVSYIIYISIDHRRQGLPYLFIYLFIYSLFILRYKHKI